MCDIACDVGTIAVRPNSDIAEDRTDIGRSIDIVRQ